MDFSELHGFRGGHCQGTTAEEAEGARGDGRRRGPQRAGWYMKKHRKLFWNTLVMIMTNDHHSCRQVYQHTHHYDHHHHHPRHYACHL